MRVLIINPMPYTAETRHIQRAESIKDTMIAELCLAFCNAGHEVTMFAAEPFRPSKEEEYPFSIVWARCMWPRLFWPHRFQVMPELRQYIRRNLHQIDLIISSEVFSPSSLCAYRLAPQKTIVWHELAKHNSLLKKMPSKVWYNLVVPLLMKNVKVIARSEGARSFIRNYCANVDDIVIDHGVNLSKFATGCEKGNHFVVCSQLIKRKRIDGILHVFARYLNKYDPETLLYVIGDGEQKAELENLAMELQISDNVIFKGRLSHNELMPILSSAMAMLINTEKDNSMVSITEAIAVGTPVVTTNVPLNAPIIHSNVLGIVADKWTEEELFEIRNNHADYSKNCLQYREKLSSDYNVRQFMNVFIKGSRI